MPDRAACPRKGPGGFGVSNVATVLTFMYGGWDRTAKERFMMDSTTEWEHRPGPDRDKYADLVAHLKQHPGEWVKVRTASTDAAAWAAAHQIRTGRRAAFRPAQEFEAYTQGAEIMARYIGPAADRQDGTK